MAASAAFGTKQTSQVQEDPDVLAFHGSGNG